MRPRTKDRPVSRRAWRTTAALGAVLAASLLPMPFAASPQAGASAAAPTVTWMDGYKAPTTPAQYDRVGVIKVGSATAKNVLVLEPGTSASGAYFVPFAEWLTSTVPGWQVWCVVRRESLLQDESELDRFKDHKASAAQLFDYYLGYLKNPAITHHYTVLSTSSVEFAKSWGMNVAVQDLRVVIDVAHRLGGKVVLGGHSLGGAVVTAYATWDFSGQAGADGLAGLVFIDGGSFTPLSGDQATADLQALDKPTASPWLSFGGIAAPYAGIFSATGSAAALLDPDGPSMAQGSGLLPKTIVPAVSVTNAAQFGYALNAATSPQGLLAAGPTSGPASRPRPSTVTTSGQAKGRSRRSRASRRCSRATRCRASTEPSGTSPSGSPTTAAPSTTGTPTRPRQCSTSTRPWGTRSRHRFGSSPSARSSVARAC